MKKIIIEFYQNNSWVELPHKKLQSENTIEKAREIFRHFKSKYAIEYRIVEITETRRII